MSRFKYIWTIKLIQIIRGVSVTLALSTAAVTGYPSRCKLCTRWKCRAWWKTKDTPCIYEFSPYLAGWQIYTAVLFMNVPKNASVLFISENSTHLIQQSLSEDGACDHTYLLTILIGEELLNCKWLNINVIKRWTVLRQHTWEIWVQFYVGGGTAQKVEEESDRLMD